MRLQVTPMAVRGLFLILALLAGGRRAQSQAPALPVFGQAVALGRDLDLSAPLSYAQFSDGSFVYVEFRSQSITKVDRDGRRLWSVGQKGNGPGEFQIPYRVVVLPDQNVLVFDVGNARVTQLRADGSYVDEVRSDMVVEISNVIVLPTGEVVLSGLTRDPRGVNASLHVFTSRMKHLRSFGPLAEATDERLVRAIGPGGLSLGVDGAILHTRSYPFEVRRFDVNGREMQSFAVRTPVDEPAKRTRIVDNNGRVATRNNPRASRPSPVHELGNGTFLGGLMREGADTLLVIEPNGRIRTAAAKPAEWSTLAFIDHVQRAVWFYGERDNEPLLFRVPIRER